MRPPPPRHPRPPSAERMSLPVRRTSLIRGISQSPQRRIFIDKISSPCGNRCTQSTHESVKCTREPAITWKSGKWAKQKKNNPKTPRTNTYIHSVYKRTRHPPIAHRRLFSIFTVDSTDSCPPRSNGTRSQLFRNKLVYLKNHLQYFNYIVSFICDVQDQLSPIVDPNNFKCAPSVRNASSRNTFFSVTDRKLRHLHSEKNIKYSRKTKTILVNDPKTFCLFSPRELNNTINGKGLRDRHNYGVSGSGCDNKTDGNIFLSLNFCDTQNRYVQKKRMIHAKHDTENNGLNSECAVFRTNNVCLRSHRRRLQTNRDNNANISTSSCTWLSSNRHSHVHLNTDTHRCRSQHDSRRLRRPPSLEDIEKSTTRIFFQRPAESAEIIDEKHRENMEERGRRSDRKNRNNHDGRKKDRDSRIPWHRRWVGWWALLLSLSMTVGAGGSSLPLHKYSTRVVRTKYGPLRGIIVHAHPPVEAFLGVPYATPPLGSLRYMPPVTPSQWRSTRLADRFAPACPQLPPPLPTHQEALLQHPRARVAHLEKLLPLLKNFSEDCLYLNLYVPKIGENVSLPCLVYVHGESYEWNSGNPYDGTVLASQGHLIVVTINFRLGILGFLKTGAKGSAQGNFGLMDLVAGLHWLRENLPAFGGDPDRVTLMGHGTGAALTNFIAVSPVARELLQRVILFSGSGLSSWALQREPLTVKRKVAEQTGCHGDLLEDDIAPCLRTKSLNELLSVRIDPPRFLPGFAPFVDGTVLLNPSQVQPPSFNVAQNPSSASTVATAAGYELADFPHRTLLFGLTSTESYMDLSAQDLEFGFNETRRDRILRTYVRNAYYFHLNEIFSTLKNEYTDWDRPVQNPLNVRDATLEVLSDGHTAAPLIRLGYLHAMRGGKTFFAHFQHLSSDRDYPQRSGSVHGEDIPYCFGLPLVGGQPFFPHNYTTQDQAISRTLIEYITNFAKSGDPNSPSSPPPAPPPAPAPAPPTEPEEVPPPPLPFWDTYDTINQLYLEIGSKPEMRSHYRGHKMSLWLSLIPQLHRPGEPGLQDTSMRHHHFLEEGAHYYEGSVRPQSMQRPNLPHLVAPSVPPARPATAAPAPAAPPAAPQQPVLAPTTDCPPNTTISNRNIHKDNNNLLRKLASSHYQSYTTALTVTIAVGCFLLLLNILIFAGIYHQRDRNNGSFGDKKKEELAEAGSCSTSSGGENYDTKTLNFETQGQSYEGNKSGYNFDCKASTYQMKSGSKYDLRTFPSDCGKTAFGEYSCYDEKNLAAQYEKRSLADITLCSVPDTVEIPMQEFRNSPSKRCDNGSSIVKIDTQKPDIQRINNQGIRSLENQTSSFHENGSRLSITSVHDRHSRTTTFGEPVKVADSSTQVKFSNSGQGEGKQTTFGPDGPCEEDLASSSCSDESAFKGKENTVSVGNQSDPTTCDVGTGIDRSPSIPEAPPPPKGGAPAPGILRQTNPNPTTGIMKKRVQIQEISV